MILFHYLPKNQRAFTIVELLIVIVVIAILAAISIVAYNGIQERARVSEVSSALSQAKKKIGVWQVDNPETTPSDLATAGVSNSGNVTYQYRPGTNGVYCITATSGPTSYRISNTSSPEKGGCPGHGTGGVAAVTNLVTNPGSETAPYNASGSGCAASLSTDSQSGTNSSLMTKGGSYCFATVYYSTANTMAGKTFRISYWVKTPLTSINTTLRSNAGSGYNPSSHSVTANTWTRVSRTFSVSASDTSNTMIDIGYENAQMTSGSQFRIDSIMLTETSNDYNYADGSSPNWAWNGTANNSTSTGPAL